MIDNMDKIRGYYITVDYLKGNDTFGPSYSEDSDRFSVVTLKIDLVSKYTQYVYNYFVPSTMFTLTSWVSYLLPPTSYPARTSLLVTVFLCQVGIFTAAIKDTPNYDEGLPNTSGEMILKVDKSNISRNDIPGALVLCLHHLHLRGADELRHHLDQDGMQAAVE